MLRRVCPCFWSITVHHLQHFYFFFLIPPKLGGLSDMSSVCDLTLAVLLPSPPPHSNREQLGDNPESGPTLSRCAQNWYHNVLICKRFPSFPLSQRGSYTVFTEPITSVLGLRSGLWSCSVYSWRCCPHPAEMPHIGIQLSSWHQHIEAEQENQHLIRICDAVLFIHELPD